jgi:hypothetical protein
MTDIPSPTTPMPAIEASRVVADELRFKAKLAIGEQADASLRAVNRAREIWDVLGAAGTGAAVAKSSLVASTFSRPAACWGRWAWARRPRPSAGWPSRPWPPAAPATGSTVCWATGGASGSSRSRAT